MADSLISEKNQKLLDEAEGNVKFVLDSQQWKSTMACMQEAFNFYEGVHFTQEEESELKDRGQPMIVVNRVAVNVDNIVGQEIASRVNIGVAPRSFAPEEQQLATGLNILGQYVQERESLSYKMSVRNRHRIIGGMGWIERDVRKGSLTYENIDPFEMGWDITDYTPDLTDSRFRFRHKWVSIEEAKKQFPDHKEKIDDIVKAQQNKVLPGEVPVTIRNKDFDGTNASGGFVDTVKGRIRIVEYQYKEIVKKYRTFTAENRVIETFDEEEAKKLLDKTLEQEIVEFDADKVMVMFFTEDVLLEEPEALSIQNGNFSWQFSGWKRKLNGEFYGLVKGAIPPQKELNKRRSKAMHLLNTNRVRISPQALKDKNLEDLIDEVNRADGVVIGDIGEIELLDQNTREFGQQLQMMLRAQDEIDMVMGIFSESIGEPSNATSGIAIQKRQQGTRLNQVRSLDDHREDRKQLGRDMLSAIQASIFGPKAVEVIDEDDISNSYKMILNEPDEDGVIKNDIRSLDFDVVIEEVPEFNAPPEQIAQLVQQVLMNGQGAFLTQPEVLSILGVPSSSAKRISSAFGKALQAVPQEAEAEAPTAGDAVTPSLG